MPNLRWIRQICTASAIALLSGCEPVTETTETAPEPLAQSDDSAAAADDPAQDPDDAAAAEDPAETVPAEETKETPEVAETVESKRCYASTSGSGVTEIQTAATDSPQTNAETQQALLESGFEVPCPELLTPDFIATLQRALAARDYYTGPISGEMNAGTRAAIAEYQAKDGLISDTLSLATARKLGLVAVERPEGG